MLTIFIVELFALLRQCYASRGYKDNTRNGRLDPWKQYHLIIASIFVIIFIVLLLHFTTTIFVRLGLQQQPLKKPSPVVPRSRRTVNKSVILVNHYDSAHNSADPSYENQPKSQSESKSTTKPLKNPDFPIISTSES